MDGKKILFWGTMALVATLGTYAAYSIYQQVQLLKSIKVAFSNIKVLGKKGGEIGFNVILAIKNPSDITFTVDEINIDLYANGAYINKVSQKIGQKISAKQTSNIGFDIYIDIADVFKNVGIVGLIKDLNYKNIKIKVVGYVSASADGIDIKNFPIQIEDTIGNLIQK